MWHDTAVVAHRTASHCQCRSKDEILQFEWHLWDQQHWFVECCYLTILYHSCSLKAGIPRVVEPVFWNSYCIFLIFISKATHWRSIPWWWFTSWRDGTGLPDRLWSQHAVIGETDDFKWCLWSGCLRAVRLAGILWLVSCLTAVVMTFCRSWCPFFTVCMRCLSYVFLFSR